MRKKCLLAVVLCLAAAAVHAQPVPSAYVPLAPCRAFDSRISQGGSGPITGGSTLFLVVRETCDVPANATAVTFTVSAWMPVAQGNLLVWEEGILKPLATTLNFNPLAVFSTGGSTRLCYPLEECSDDIQIQPSQTTDIILDITGAYIPLDSIEAATSAVAGQVTEVNVAPDGPGGQAAYDFLLDNGLHVSCVGTHINTDLCASADVGDKLTTTGTPKNLFGSVHVYAMDYLSVSE